jgi:ketosteroid isomerase-like protein
MKRMQTGAMLLFMLLTANLHAQNWSPAQKEVWSNVEAYWDLQSKGNLDGFLSYFSDNYLGWDNDSPVPQNKAAVAKYSANGLKNRKTLFYDITPVSIQIHDDVAIVNYYFNIQSENMEGKKNWDHGRWTDILQRQGQSSGKWVLIGDHGGSAPEKD